MTYVPYKGGTLLVPSGPSGMHLFVILTNKCQHGSHLWVSLTSVREGKMHDEASVFSGGEHPFIKRQSYVYYRDIGQKRSTAIAFGVASGLLIPREDMGEASLAAICAGIEKSDFVGSWAIEYYLANKDN